MLFSHRNGSEDSGEWGEGGWWRAVCLREMVREDFSEEVALEPKPE